MWGKKMKWVETNSKILYLCLPDQHHAMLSRIDTLYHVYGQIAMSSIAFAHYLRYIPFGHYLRYNTPIAR